jgi:anti-sigma regulatory factor (Ser/Thr protein kinase)
VGQPAGQEQGAGRSAGHGPGHNTLPESRKTGSDLGFALVHGWVPTARFAQFVRIRIEHIAESTPLHVFLLLRLPASPLAASVARHAVAGLAPYLDEGVAENAELLVSELVTNSVRHAGLPEEACIEFSVRASAEVLMVEVADGGQGFDHALTPRPRVAGVAEASGWGLFLVERIADRWGAVKMDGETRVWFELSPGAIGTNGFGAVVG